jgi:hypothetical protein
MSKEIRRIAPESDEENQRNIVYVALINGDDLGDEYVPVDIGDLPERLPLGSSEHRNFIQHVRRCVVRDLEATATSAGLQRADVAPRVAAYFAENFAL